MGNLNRGTAEQKGRAEQKAQMEQGPQPIPAPGPARTGGGLARYVAAATLARTADGGAVVAIVLMVTTSGAPGWLAGLLGACITAPHLLGPLVARSLDSCRDGRVLIAWACMVHGATLAAAVLLYPVAWPVTGILLVVSGLVGPLLTGGISSRLPAIAGPGQVSQRRAQGWDVATYGIGGTIGPSVVAAVSAWAGPTAAALILAAATFVAAAVVRLLPYVPPAAVAAEVPRPVQTLRLMAVTGRLRRMLYLTATVAFSVAALPIAAVASTAMFHVQPAAAGVLTAAYGLGGLAGSAGVMCRPLRGDADRLVTRLAGAVAAALAVAALSGSFVPAAAAYAAAGVMNSYFFAATLAARSEFAPPQVRGQVFVWVGALKIAAGSAGTAAAGVVITGEPQLPLFLVAALIVAVAGASVLDRRNAGGPDPG
ncbi:MFS transporter [Arthrobacter sp. NPDC056691]|uniref:MFS transporter n=1 Tax=Arthrobacter sp. NPDC056691 TaxID=3345913 RepID=UPI003672B6B9